MYLLMADMLRRGRWRWGLPMVLVTAAYVWAGIDLGEPTRGLGGSLGWALGLLQ